MIIGHAGIALSVRRYVPRVRLVWLLFSAYLPDALRLVLIPLIGLRDANLASHSVPGILAQALVLALATRTVADFRSAAYVAAVCALHWPADVFTGCKPVISGETLGFAMYQQPGWDLLVEGGVFLIGWWSASRWPSWPKWLASRWVVAGAVSLQILVLAYMASTSSVRFNGSAWAWRPARGLSTFVRLEDIGRSCSP